MKDSSQGTGEMAQRSRVPAALPEDQDLILSDYMAVHKCLITLISGDLVPSPGLHGHPALVVYRDVCRQINTHTHKIKTLKQSSVQKKGSLVSP